MSMILMLVGYRFLVILKANMLVICPTGGQAINILRYEDLDTGGMCAKAFEGEGDVPDLVLVEKCGAGA